MYSVELTKTARKALLRLPRTDRQRIQGKLEYLADNPHHPELDIKPLKGREAWRLRVGDWRIIYEIHDQWLVVQIIRIGSRGEVYK
ncbi:mRNA interferase RelE/StbE [Thiohalospira halophila DSM 15071]|jgi:mRNA interferase RelE/StbE|uniref:mRNA interferase RelE/StbE n=1 Tax=Thiohalospira halophila DSM 15071 TaxID=1123397 RepID=A0A1I1SBQ4_9GAMM|nr:type II toxin-antitoxin system RelE/ParE family toxin [Thiohalospira halophila]SFD43896.1 mRNA interferase RelE/StbE [Thiohalospira halophila DSM 15071]